MTSQPEPPDRQQRHSEPFSPPDDAFANLTALLIAWSEGDPTALDALVPYVYEELRRQAARAVRGEAPGQTLQATALVHEAYLRLAATRRVHWENRSQFFAVAGQLMRRILVDHARARNAAKRGGGVAMQSTEAADALAAALPAEPDGESAVDVLALDAALARLGRIDPEQARLVELRFFAGLTIEETAAACGTSPATVKREWAVARAWLRRELAKSPST